MGKRRRIFVDTSQIHKKKITAKSVNKKVNRILSHIEMKRTLRTLQTVVTDSGLVTWLSSVDKGTGGDDRIGEEIVSKSIEIAYRLNFTAASTHDFEVIRVLVFVHKTQQGLNPVPSVILENLTVESPINQALQDRYRFIYDKTHVLNRLSALAVDTATHVFRKKIRLRNMKVHFNQTTIVEGTGVGGEKNQILLLVFTSASANGATLNFSSDFRYTDL